jgi:hypothetical protein
MMLLARSRGKGRVTVRKRREQQQQGLVEAGRQREVGCFYVPVRQLVSRRRLATLAMAPTAIQSGTLIMTLAR